MERKTNADEVRKILPATVIKDFDDIVFQKVLGASKHIKMIGEMIEAICIEDCKSEMSPTVFVEHIHLLGNFFIQTRGEASQAITNAIYLMIDGMEDDIENIDIKAITQRVIKQKNTYFTGAEKNMKQVVKYGVEIANRCEKIMIYDYSSTVEAILCNVEDAKTIYIAESRAINGGYPFVKPCLDKGHRIKFFPDASIMYYVKDCDLVFMGVETFYPDGTGFNTIGSDMVALTCNYYKIPLYMVTPLIKLDIRPVYGKRKELVINDLSDKLSKVATPENHATEIDYRTPELIGVCPEHIHSFITEKGIIPSTQMYDISIDYIRQLRGEDYV